jgi:ethanolamine utilization protein EutA
LLPLKNIPALKLTPSEQDACYQGNTDLLLQRVNWFMEQSNAENLILALPGKQNPEYGELKTLAACLAQALYQALPARAPMLIVLEQDTAKALGVLLTGILQGKRKVICIDSIKVEQGDYVDLGFPVLDGQVIPVVVKTLLFG